MDLLFYFVYRSEFRTIFKTCKATVVNGNTVKVFSTKYIQTIMECIQNKCNMTEGRILYVQWF